MQSARTGHDTRPFCAEQARPPLRHPSSAALFLERCRKEGQTVRWTVQDGSRAGQAGLTRPERLASSPATHHLFKGKSPLFMTLL
jgi:hypothetical protein